MRAALLLLLGLLLPLRLHAEEGLLLHGLSCTPDQQRHALEQARSLYPELSGNPRSLPLSANHALPPLVPVDSGCAEVPPLPEALEQLGKALRVRFLERAEQAQAQVRLSLSCLEHPVRPETLAHALLLHAWLLVQQGKPAEGQATASLASTIAPDLSLLEVLPQASELDGLETAIQAALRKPRAPVHAPSSPKRWVDGQPLRGNLQLLPGDHFLQEADETGKVVASAWAVLEPSSRRVQWPPPGLLTPHAEQLQTRLASSVEHWVLDPGLEPWVQTLLKQEGREWLLLMPECSATHGPRALLIWQDGRQKRIEAPNLTPSSKPTRHWLTLGLGAATVLSSAGWAQAEVERRFSPSFPSWSYLEALEQRRSGFMLLTGLLSVGLVTSASITWRGGFVLLPEGATHTQARLWIAGRF